MFLSAVHVNCNNYLTDINNVEYTPGTEPPYSCQDGFYYYWYGCYKLEIVPRSWSNADAHCRTLGGHLASIHDPAENAYIYTIARGEWPLWIGLHDVRFHNILNIHI